MGHKLRNKKTGEIVDGGFILIPACTGFIGNPSKSVAEVNDTWEDYEPKEPLIKDEKIRKAVRAWAEAARTTSVDIQGNELESKQNDSWIIFDGQMVGLVADDGDNYTIEELCGEEEE